MNTVCILFSKNRVRSSRRFRNQMSLVTFAFTTVLMVALMAIFGKNLKAQPCPAGAMYPQCSNAIGPNSCCDIVFNEDVFNIPPHLDQILGPFATNPAPIQRRARVWTGDGTLASPPVIFWFGGSGTTAPDAAADADLDFDSEWPQAIVVYTEATRLTGHNCKWERPEDTWPIIPPNWNPHICWSDRFPYCDGIADHSDLPYVRMVLAELDNLFSFNNQQVYAAAHSSGCFFTFSLMHFMPETFRAFAVTGCYADYERKGNDIAAIVAMGQKLPSRPVLYMMGEDEDVFPWLPAFSLGDHKVHDSIRQLTARNGAEVPGQDDTKYLVKLVIDVRDKAPDGVESFTFNPVKPNSAEVELIVYGGDHSLPPRDADDTRSNAVEWIVDFFQRHLVAVPEEPIVVFDQGWTVPVLMAPVLF